MRSPVGEVGWEGVGGKEGVCISLGEFLIKTAGELTFFSEQWGKDHELLIVLAF